MTDLDWSAVKAHFDATLRCGDVQHPREIDEDWVPVNGCGASDWRVKRVFFKAEPGNLIEIECNVCKRKRGATMDLVSG